MPSAAEISQMIVTNFKPEKVDGIDAVVQFDLSGDNGGQFYMIIKDGTVATENGVAENPRMTMKSTTEDWYKVMTGEMNGMQAFMSGKLKVTGDMGLAMKLQSALG